MVLIARTLVVAAVVAALAPAPSAGAATEAPTFAGDDVVAAPPDYATEVLGDPWDYRNREDILVDGNGPTLNVANTTLQHGRLVFDVTGSGYVSPVFPGFPGAIPAGREGTHRPIDASRYDRATFRMYSSVRVPAALMWFGCPAFEDRCLGGHRFTAEPGWHTYELPMVNEFPGLPVAWAGAVLGLRVALNAETTAHVEVDWMRLHRAAPGTRVEWTNPSPGSRSSLLWDADADPSNNTADRPGWGVLGTTTAETGTATFPAGMAPGAYRFLATSGGNRTPYSRPLTVDRPPQPVIDDPDEAGGADYATVVLRDPWDLSQASDVAKLGNVTGVSFSDGMLQATNGGPTVNDPYVLLRQQGTIDPARFHRLTVRMTYDGPFDLADAPGGGTHGRLLWQRQDRGDDFQDGREIVTYTTVDTYTADLATDPAGAISEDGPGWTGSPITAVRWDPNEDRGARRWRLDAVELRADDRTTSGRAFDIRWHDEAHTEGTTVDLYADTDRRGFDGRLIASGVVQRAGANTYRWVASDVPDGRYWIHVSASNGVSSSRTYAGGPVRVSGTAPPSRPAVTARSIEPACPTGDVPEDGASDVPAGNVHEAAIDCVAWWDIAKGRTDGTYRPAWSVSRAQMASFVARTILESGGALPSDPPDAFDDDDGDPHEHAIDQLAAVGVVTGDGQGGFSPDVPVTRAQMATFLARSLEHRLGQPLAATRDWFADDESSPHQANINRVAEAGIATGTSTGVYAPAQQVRRDQMASFLARTLALLVDEGVTTPPA
ncbi:MAG: S-layer homology domain-containing protein [Actinobacteria bacterium]|nr:S-layer homology domain-containing protein [Actinomycetota bacterium]